MADVQEHAMSCESLVDIPSTGVTKSSTTIAFWQRQLGLAQVTKLRGNCWRKHGFCINTTNFFYPEEALLLFEKGFLLVTKTAGGSDYLTKQELYEYVLEVISLACYLTYARLKSLDYIVFRHKKNIRSFRDNEELKALIQCKPSLNLLDIMTSFDIYIEDEGFSKRIVREKMPLSYVTVTESYNIFPIKVVLKLVEEAAGVPIFFAAVTNTGFVIIEEFADAEKSLEIQNSKRNLKKIYGRPHIGKYVDVAKFGADEDDIDEKERDSMYDLTVKINAQDSDEEVNFSS